MPSTAVSGDRRAVRAWPFVTRWVAAVALSMVAAGSIEYAIAVAQLEERSLAEAANGYQADLGGLTAVLSADLTPDARQAAIEHELEQVGRTYGTEYAALMAPDGRLLNTTGLREAPEDKADAVRSVVSSGRPSWDKEHDEGEAGQERRYEFLLPVRTADGQDFVVEVDQRADVVGGLLADLRVRKIWGLLLGLLVAVPLSYLFGGRSLHRRQARAEHAADTDALTGIAGRRRFRSTVGSALADPACDSTVLALIDIDDFKSVNDRLGHSYGDRVLCAFAKAFDVLRASDTAFRLGGDEFAVVLTGSSDARAVAVIERVRQALVDSAPGITFSCGVAAATSAEAVAVQELWERADAALYEAKHRGRRQTVSFSAMTDSLTVSADKLDAVTALLSDDTALGVAFQPIWDLRAGRLLGHEALLRLPAETPVEGPEEAFALAQRLGVAAQLDEQARRVALRAVAEHDWDGLLFLNVHPDALPGLDVDALVTNVTAAGLSTTQVVLEVTEHDGLDSPEPIRVLKSAQARGFRLALDDMGAGNAGLRALSHVRFGILKLDRQVTARLGIDPASDATVAAATAFVQQTGGWVVAEGIEDADMLTAVLSDTHRPRLSAPMIAGQGYFLGRPAPTPTAIETPLDQLTAPSPHLLPH